MRWCSLHHGHRQEFSRIRAYLSYPLPRSIMQNQVKTAVLLVLPPTVAPLSIIELTLAFSQPKVKNNFNSPIFLQQMWKCKYVETSAKEGTNVNELFEELLKLETSRTLRWSTCPLVYFIWLLDHVTYLKLRNNLLLLQAEQFHKVITLFTQNFTTDHFEWKPFCEFAQLVTTEISISLNLR